MVCTVHRQSGEFLARRSRRGDQRFRRVPVRPEPEFHGHGAKLENGNESLMNTRYTRGITIHVLRIDSDGAGAIKVGDDASSFGVDRSIVFGERRSTLL